MVGVQIVTATRNGPATPGFAPGGAFFVPGITERGRPDLAMKLNSLADYTRIFGDRVSYGTIYDTIRTYFEEGGLEAWVVRKVGSSATVGTLSLMDGAGTPLATVRVDAADAGAWSARVSVQVAASATSGHYHFYVLLDGVIQESYLELTSPADLAAALTGSQYVRGTNLGSATAAPTNNPAVLAATPLTAGNDQRGSLVAGDFVTALARFGPELGDGAVAIPGFTSAQVGAGLLAHCTAYYRIALLATAAGQTAAQAKAAAAALASTTGSEGAVLLWPWVVIPDGTTLRTISPEGFAAACRARAILAAGPWRPPAGSGIAKADYVSDLETPVDQITGDDLNVNHVSALRRITLNGPVVLYGWRSLSLDSANYYLATVRDVLNRIESAAKGVLEEFVFTTIDSRGQRLSDLKARLVGILDPLAYAGAFATQSGDRGYATDVGPSVNTVASLQANLLKALIVVRPIGAAETVQLTVVRAISGSTL